MSLPGLVNQIGPSKQNFKWTYQRKPWQGGGVTGGGQARTGHGNWFQSQNPFSTNSRGSVILKKTMIPGEDRNYTSGSAIKTKTMRKNRGFGILGPEYPTRAPSDEMQIDGQSLIMEIERQRDSPLGEEQRQRIVDWLQEHWGRRSETVFNSATERGTETASEQSSENTEMINVDTQQSISRMAQEAADALGIQLNLDHEQMENDIIVDGSRRRERESDDESVEGERETQRRRIDIG